jgi:hypothetical protein
MADWAWTSSAAREVVLRGGNQVPEPDPKDVVFGDAAPPIS